MGQQGDGRRGAKKQARREKEGATPVKEAEPEAGAVRAGGGGSRWMGAQQMDERRHVPPVVASTEIIYRKIALPSRLMNYFGPARIEKSIFLPKTLID